MLWYRQYAEWAYDPKIQSLDEPSQRRHTMLLCLHCDGVLQKLKEDEIAFALRISLEDLLKTKETFIQKGFIDDKWNVIKWDKRQYKSDRSAERTRAYRNNKKSSSSDVTSLNRHSDGRVTVPDSESESESKSETNKNPSTSYLSSTDDFSQVPPITSKTKRQPRRERTTEETAKPETKARVLSFATAYEAVVGSKYVVNWPRDCSLMKGVSLSVAEIDRLTRIFLSDSNAFKGNCDIPSFVKGVNRLQGMTVSDDKKQQALLDHYRSVAGR